MFVANNINYYKFYSDIHNINAGHIIDLYQPSSSLWDILYEHKHF
jgi:hypothetical protein